MANAVEKCVHCGFCLATCPTYVVLGEEMDSPRGRITLMKSALEGALPVESALPYVDRCLGCMACVTACPSGVPYADLLMPFRGLAEKQRSRGIADRVARTLTRETLPYPDRFRLAAAAGRLARPMQSALPSKLGAMLNLLPAQVPPAQPLPAVIAAQGQRRGRVALLAGCVQQALAPEINWAVVRVLARNGVEVVIPPEQGCCGSLMLHGGEAAAARALARRNLQAFPADVDAVLTTAAGCGSGMHEYGLLFVGEPEEAAARALAARTQDVSAFLAELGLVEPPPPLPQPLRVAYHDACHLAHAQGVSAAPRRLLRAIPNLTLLEVPEGELCCGSAGTYNLEQPGIAATLGRRKAENHQRTHCDAVATGNIGCLVQIRQALRQLAGPPLPLYHTLQVLDMAYASLDEGR